MEKNGCVCYTKSEILTKVKGLIFENDLADIVYLSDNNVLKIRENIKNRLIDVIDFCDPDKENFKTKSYYELICDFGGEVIQNTVFMDNDLVFYSHFIDDSDEANQIVEKEIKCMISDFFSNYKKNNITKENERVLSNHIKNVIESKISPYELELLSRLSWLYIDINNISSDLVNYLTKNEDNLNIKNKINMINNMLIEINDILSKWVKITGCSIEDISNYEYMENQYNSCFTPKYEKDLRKVLSLKNIKNALIKFSNEKDDLYMRSIEENGKNVDNPIMELLKQDLSYGLPSVDEIFSDKGKVKIKK